MTDNLTAKIAELAANAKQGPFEAVKRTGSWFVVGADGWKLAHCYTEEDARLIEELVVNLPTLLALAAENDALKAENERLRKRPWCETCGKDVPEVLCPTCAKWWADNPCGGPDLTTLRAQLADARREGMEDAARIAEACELYNDIDQRLHSDIRETCAVAIRTAIEQGAPATR